MKIDKEYIPQTQRTDEEMSEKAYGKKYKKPQSKMSEEELTDKSYGKWGGPQTQLSRDEMNALAYGKKGGPQTQMGKDQMDKVAYGKTGKPQTKMSSDELADVAYGAARMPMAILGKFTNALLRGGNNAWKIQYKQITGNDPDVLGITKGQALLVINNYLSQDDDKDGIPNSVDIDMQENKTNYNVKNK
jgi:hypothetical protein